MTAATGEDVLIVGAGPVGLTVAALLGRQGVRTVLVEAAAAPTGQPRAIALHGDALRVLASIPGLTDWIGQLHPARRVHFVDAAGRKLLDLAFGHSPGGLPDLSLFHQPALEAVLWGAIARLPSVRVRTGVAVTELTLNGALVRAYLADGSCQDASWVVGCDGAASTVRRSAGISFPGHSAHQARWLVADVDTDHRLPALRHFHYVCDPRRPTVAMPRPGGYRWEWQLRAGENPHVLTDPPALHQLLAPWLPAGLHPAELHLARAADYTYHARLADRWQVGQVLLAGDAAHCLPPFAGQGLSSGLRDAAALAWRLAAVLKGAHPRLLADYERERRPHVRSALRTSRLVGSVLQTGHPALALAVAGSLRTANRTPLLGPWLQSGGPRPPDRLPAAGHRRLRGGGRLVPHALLRGPDGQAAPLDLLLPPSWVVLTLTAPPALPSWLIALDAVVHQLVPDAGPPSSGALVETPGRPRLGDVDGSLSRLLSRLGGPTAAGVIRPDRYLLGVWPARRLPAAFPR